MTYDYLVFIGRFQPYHNGHQEILKSALRRARNVIVLVGSADAARSPRNPFTFGERYAMIKHSIANELDYPTSNRLHILPIKDYPYNNARWVAQVQKTVHDYVLDYENPNKHTTIHGLNNIKIGLIGHSKDASSFYLKLFPAWTSTSVPVVCGAAGPLNSTDIRHEYFQSGAYWPDGQYIDLPFGTASFLNKFWNNGDYRDLKDWYNYDCEYKASWANTPYPVIFSCVDSVVVQSGHVLLIRRKHQPGRGLLAIPGGHVNPDEPFKDAAIRELKEETRIADDRGEIPPAMLESFIDDTKTRLFDDPYRSSRGRVITQAYLFNLPDRTKLFKVRGDDDAESAQWYPIGEVKSNEMFEDHYHILDTMLGGI